MRRPNTRATGAKRVTRVSCGALAVLAGLGLSSLATCLTAQTLPVPTLPQPVAAPKRPAPWEYALGVGIGWDSNVEFTSEDGLTSGMLLPQADIARLFASTKGETRVSTRGRWVGYSDQEVRSRSYLDGEVRGAYHLSTTTRLSGDARYELGYTDSSRTLSDQGVLLPLVKTQTLRGELHLAQSLDPRTTLQVDGRAFRTHFEDEAFVDSDSERGALTLERKLGARDAGAIAYAIERAPVDPEQGSLLTHYASLQWSRTVSKFSALLLEGGASYTPEASATGLGRSESFYGGFTFARQVRASNLVAYVRREVAPAFGLGASRLETRLGLQADVPIGRSSLRIAGSYVQPSTGEGAEVLYASSTDASMEVSRRFGRRLVVAAQARYRRRGETTTAHAASAVQAMVSVSIASEAR